MSEARVIPFRPRWSKGHPKKPFIAVEDAPDLIEWHDRLIGVPHGAEALALANALVFKSVERLRAGDGQFLHDRMTAFALGVTPCTYQRRRSQFPDLFACAEVKIAAAYTRLCGGKPSEKPTEKPSGFQSENSTKSKDGDRQILDTSSKSWSNDQEDLELVQTAPDAAPCLEASSAPAQGEQRGELRIMPEPQSPPAQPVAPAAPEQREREREAYLRDREARHRELEARQEARRRELGVGEINWDEIAENNRRHEAGLREDEARALEREARARSHGLACRCSRCLLDRFRRADAAPYCEASTAPPAPVDLEEVARNREALAADALALRGRQ